jgi:hypothetical protein
LRTAQDLLFQTIRESEVALAAVAESYCVSDAPNWIGDSNAHSMQWGELRDEHQRKMVDRLGLGLLLANKGTASTCVARRGSSVVDVTWATSELYQRIRDWRVADSPQ